MIVKSSRLLIVSFLLTLSVDADRPDKDAPDETLKHLKVINGYRRKVAKKWKIANMHELSWDDNLVAAMNGIKCGSAPSSVPGRVVPILKDTGTLTETLKKLLLAWKKDRNGGKPLFNAEVSLNPLQTRIGCVKLECKEYSAELNMEIEISGFCAMGPEKTFGKSSLKRGKPGDACGSLKANKGLCVSPKSGNAKPSSGSLAGLQLNSLKAIPSTHLKRISVKAG